MSEAPNDLSTQPLIDHLLELRKRIFYALLAFFSATILSYLFAAQIYGFLVRPLADAFPDPENRRLIYTGLTEAFTTYLRLAAFAGLFLSFPIIAAQFYYFLAPGLYKKERRTLLPYLLIAPVLFSAGAAFAYYGVFPAAWKFFISFENSAGSGGLAIQSETKVSEYLSLVMHFIIAFGVCFQLPLVLVLLVKSGMVQLSTLKRGRRYAIVIIVVIAAFITPPDVFSQIALSVPLYLLYEASILVCSIHNRKTTDV